MAVVRAYSEDASNDRVAVYSARRETRLSPIVKTRRSDYALITVIDQKARPNYVVIATRIIAALEKSRNTWKVVENLFHDADIN